jgi:hypothetical protein
MSSSDASISNFSEKGSPTWTEGRFACDSSSKVAEARTLAPPMPSRPVEEPNRISLSPGLSATPFINLSSTTPRHATLTRGLAE